MQFLFVRYSFISLKVLSALSGEALSLSQGFALVIVYTFSVIMGAQATYNSTLTILGVAIATILYGLISKHESTAKTTIRGIQGTLEEVIEGHPYFRTLLESELGSVVHVNIIVIPFSTSSLISL